ncbi:BlaI/MecI/CopY family transcriptional regulator [Marinisporobacter balticus]|uniref:BlaI family penicillinase repressor n=1 Tax=Marinisporobacter balticus TaxID=2018667 RepID=A0A4R2KAF5_9FIRM|nr:BlaI/MecI/CopY family transcriptional regulator [Marinisporobacter balticus]TCO69152.1 BlaI family penicillinase repressor [Marinisporobacter balticus]
MNMKSLISESEWQVMKVIWNNDLISANDIINALESTTTWKPKTIKTLLSRLLKKEVIDFKKDGRTYLYYPLLEEKECIKGESKAFLKRVYGGVVNAMFTNFLEDYDLTEDEIDQLKDLLEKKEKSKGDRE